MPLLHPGRVIAFAHAARPAGRVSSMKPDYSALLVDFLALLKQRRIPFVVVGGIALLQHVRGRNTEDLDLIIAAPRLSEIPELEIRERTELFFYGYFHALRVDVLLAEHPVFGLVADKFTQPMPYEVGELPTASIDGLILLKLFALPSLYRVFDYDRIAIYEADLTQLLARSSSSNSWFLDCLTPHLLSSDVGELESILADIRRRLRRMKAPE